MNNRAMMIAIWVCILLLSACTKEKPIGEIKPLKSDYVLPQGKSPADKRVVELYEKYGSYFLYEFSRRDFYWKFYDPNLYANKEASQMHFYTPADPKYVGNMLDYINEAWFRYFPDSLLKKSIPYRVLFVATLNEQDEDNKLKAQSVLFEHSRFVFAGCDKTIKKISAEEKNEKRIVLQYKLLSFLTSTELLNLPQKFYKVSNYSPNVSDNPKSKNYARKRGFLTLSDGEEWSLELLEGEDTREYDLQKDIESYLYWSIARTDKEWKKDFTFPLVKQKYNLLIKHFKDKFGINIKKMANDSYE